jgi:hypothetical protein
MHQTSVEGGLELEAKLLVPAPRPSWVDRLALAYELACAADRPRTP